MIVILGPTATGKTAIATHLADQINGEIISADSRQVYVGMDIGTGKDLSEYCVNGKDIPYHLIDVAQPGTEFSMFDFHQRFHQSYQDILSRNKYPILCGGTGLYLESVIKAYPMVVVEQNKILRDQLIGKSMDELSEILTKFRKLHNLTDTETRERVLRAIEIETYYQNFPEEVEKSRLIIEPLHVFGVDFDREIIRTRITQRLKERLEGGMIDEVKQLLDNGVTHERLQRYGLEYKFVSLYLLGIIDYQTLFDDLNIAIRQFAKRQTTWFRRMEKSGVNIHWIDGEDLNVNKVKKIMDMSSL